MELVRKSQSQQVRHTRSVNDPRCLSMAALRQEGRNVSLYRPSAVAAAAHFLGAGGPGTSLDSLKSATRTVQDRDLSNVNFIFGSAADFGINDPSDGGDRMQLYNPASSSTGRSGISPFHTTNSVENKAQHLLETGILSPKVGRMAKSTFQVVEREVQMGEGEILLDKTECFVRSTVDENVVFGKSLIETTKLPLPKNKKTGEGEQDLNNPLPDWNGLGGNINASLEQTCYVKEYAPLLRRTGGLEQGNKKNVLMNASSAARYLGAAVQEQSNKPGKTGKRYLKALKRFFPGCSRAELGEVARCYPVEVLERLACTEEEGLSPRMGNAWRKQWQSQQDEGEGGGRGGFHQTGTSTSKMNLSATFSSAFGGGGGDSPGASEEERALERAKKYGFSPDTFINAAPAALLERLRKEHENFEINDDLMAAVLEELEEDESEDDGDENVVCKKNGTIAPGRGAVEGDLLMSPGTSGFTSSDPNWQVLQPSNRDKIWRSPTIHRDAVKLQLRTWSDWGCSGGDENAPSFPELPDDINLIRKLSNVTLNSDVLELAVVRPELEVENAGREQYHVEEGDHDGLWVGSPSLNLAKTIHHVGGVPPQFPMVDRLDRVEQRWRHHLFRSVLQLGPDLPCQKLLLPVYGGGAACSPGKAGREHQREQLPAIPTADQLYVRNARRLNCPERGSVMFGGGQLVVGGAPGSLDFGNWGLGDDELRCCREALLKMVRDCEAGGSTRAGSSSGGGGEQSTFVGVVGAAQFAQTLSDDKSAGTMSRALSASRSPSRRRSSRSPSRSQKLRRGPSLSLQDRLLKETDARRTTENGFFENSTFHAVELCRLQKNFSLKLAATEGATICMKGPTRPEEQTRPPLDPAYDSTAGIRHLCLSGGNFTATGLAEFLEVFSSKKFVTDAPLLSALEQLDLSNNPGLKELPRFPNLLPPTLLKINLADWPLNSAFQPLLEQLPFRTPLLQDLCLRNTGLGRRSQADIALLCYSAIRLKYFSTLDISSNYVLEEGFSAVKSLMVSSKSVRDLNLSYNVRTTFQNSSKNPTNLFVESLEFAPCLASLDLSHSGADYSTAFILESALADHPTFRQLFLAGSTLGSLGIECFLRLVANDVKGMLLDIDLSEFQDTANLHQNFDAKNPTGQYGVRLSDPYDRCLFRKKLVPLAGRSAENGGSGMKSGMGGMRVQKVSPESGERQTMSQAEVLNLAEEVELALQNGDEQILEGVNLEVSYTAPLTEELIAADAEEFRLDGNRLIQKWERGRRSSLGLRQFAVVSSMFDCFLVSEYHFRAFLRALADSCLLKTTHLRLLVEKAGVGTPYAREIVSTLIPVIGDVEYTCKTSDGGLAVTGSTRLAIIELAPSAKDRARILTLIRSLVFFNARNPTGRYRLALDQDCDYALAERLFLINTWEKALVRSVPKRSLLLKERGGVPVYEVEPPAIGARRGSLTGRLTGGTDLDDQFKADKIKNLERVLFGEGGDAGAETTSGGEAGSSGGDNGVLSPAAAGAVAGVVPLSASEGAEDEDDNDLRPTSSASDAEKPSTPYVNAADPRFGRYLPPDLSQFGNYDGFRNLTLNGQLITPKVLKRKPIESILPSFQEIRAGATEQTAGGMQLNFDYVSPLIPSSLHDLPTDGDLLDQLLCS